MRKCTLPDTEESKQIRRTVDQHGLVHDRVKPTKQAKLPQSQAAKREQPSSFPGAKLVTSPKQLRASVTERQYHAPRRST